MSTLSVSAAMRASVRPADLDKMKKFMCDNTCNNSLEKVLAYRSPTGAGKVNPVTPPTLGDRGGGGHSKCLTPASAGAARQAGCRMPPKTGTKPEMTYH